MALTGSDLVVLGGLAMVLVSQMAVIALVWLQSSKRNAELVSLVSALTGTIVNLNVAERGVAATTPLDLWHEQMGTADSGAERAGGAADDFEDDQLS